MANNDFTEPSIIPIDGDSFNEAAICLNHAHGVLDVIYTLEISSNDSTQGLCNGSLSAALDAAMTSITKAKELLTPSSALKKEVK